MGKKPQLSIGKYHEIFHKGVKNTILLKFFISLPVQSFNKPTGTQLQLSHP